jgi:cell division protein FtsB
MKRRLLEIFLVLVVAGFVFSIVGLARMMEQTRITLEDEQQRLDKIDDRMGRTEKNLETITKELHSLNREFDLDVLSRTQKPFCGYGDPCDGGTK